MITKIFLKRNSLLFLLAAVFLTGLFKSLVTPIFEFPDEQSHFATIQFLSETGKMPDGLRNDLSIEMKTTEDLLGTFRDRRYGTNRYTYHPDYHPLYTAGYTGVFEAAIKNLNTPLDRKTFVAIEAARYPFLYYLYGSVFYKIADGADLFTRLFFVRVGTVLLFVSTVAISYFLGRTLFEHDDWALGLALLVALQPMFSFLGSGVNSDNLHNLLATIFLWLCVRLIKNGWSSWLFALIGIVIGLDFLTKPQAYILVAILFGATCFRLKTRSEILPAAKGLLLSITIFTLMAFWQEGSKILTILSGGASYSGGGTPYLNPLLVAKESPDFLSFMKFSINKFISQNIIWYWGVFKWLGVVLPKPLWWLANRMLALSAIGVVASFFLRKKLIERKLVMFLVTSSLLYGLAIFLYDWTFFKSFGYSFGVQARYYFPMITFHLALILVGLLTLPWTNRLRRLTWLVLLLFFILLQLGSIVTVLSSYYSFSTVSVFITQASQYKPEFAKGGWLVILSLGYISGIFYLIYSGLQLGRGKAKNQESSHL